MSLSEDKNRPLNRELVASALRGFVTLPSEEAQVLAGVLRRKVLRRGEFLTRSGEVATTFGLVTEGLIRKQTTTPSGRTVVRDFGAPGTWVGAYASLLTGQPSYLDVEATLDSELIVLPWADLTALYARHPVWQELGRKMAEHFLLEREARAHDLLTLSAQERYAQFLRSHAAVVPHLKNYEIASYLGITPVSLSRIRGRRASSP